MINVLLLLSGQQIVLLLFLLSSFYDSPKSKSDFAEALNHLSPLGRYKVILPWTSAQDQDKGHWQKKFQENWNLTRLLFTLYSWSTPFANTPGHECLCQQPRKKSEDIGSFQLFLLLNDFPGPRMIPTHPRSKSWDTGGCWDSSAFPAVRLPCKQWNQKDLEKWSYSTSGLALVWKCFSAFYSLSGGSRYEVPTWPD